MISTKKKLSRVFDDLDDHQQEMLLDFAEFLQARTGKIHTIPKIPLSIPRPPTESVIAAIKRLATTYPMLEQARLFNETSMLMTTHIMEGRSSKEVIDDLEILFKHHFEKWRNEMEVNKASEK
ncbi:conserved hypothetical protein [Gammaproteobacteria bacterium]